jgi:hypothetical protein
MIVDCCQYGTYIHLFYISEISKNVDSETNQELMNSGKHQQLCSKDLLPFAMNIALLMSGNKEDTRSEYVSFIDATKIK